MPVRYCLLLLFGSCVSLVTSTVSFLVGSYLARCSHALFPNSFVLVPPKRRHFFCIIAWCPFGMVLHSLVMVAAKSKRLCCCFWPSLRGVFPFFFLPLCALCVVLEHTLKH